MCAYMNGWRRERYGASPRAGVTAFRGVAAAAKAETRHALIGGWWWVGGSQTHRALLPNCDAPSAAFGGVGIEDVGAYAESDWARQDLPQAGKGSAEELMVRNFEGRGGYRGVCV